MEWEIANTHGILAKGSTQNTFGVDPPQFNAGQANGVVNFDAQPESSPPKPAVTLVSTPTSGVWRLDDPNTTTTWIPLSLTWQRTDLTCLVKGRRTNSDVFAAGGSTIDNQGTLFENNWSDSDPFDKWNSIDLSGLSIGIINSVTTIFPSGLPIIVLACDNGLFWSITPDGPGGIYSFRKAIVPPGLVDKWSSVAQGSGKYPDSPLLAAPWGSGVAQAALFRGFFSDVPTSPTSELLLEPIGLPFPSQVNPPISRVLVAAALDDDRKRFVIVGGQSKGIDFVFRMTEDKNTPWEAAGTTVGGVANALTTTAMTGQLQDWAGALAFSATNAQALVIGWQTAYFLSTNYGSNWTRIDTSNSANIHPGIHAIQFTDELNSQQNSLSIASDGGLFTTTDAGRTHSSTVNQSFPNLQFTNGALDNHTIGFVAASLSNDRNLYTSMYGTPQLWQPLRDNDVGPVTFLRNGMLLDYDNLQSTSASSLQSTLQSRRLDPFNRPYGYLSSIDPILFNDASTAPGTGGTIDLSINLRPLEPVDVPASVDVNSESLVAIAGRNFEVCGLILGQQDAQHENIAVHVLGSPTATETITAVASPDGTSVIVGTDHGNFFRGVPVPGAASFSFNFSPMPNLTPLPHASVMKISSRKNSRLFAIVQGRQLLRLEGSGWDSLPGPPVTEEYTSLLVVPSESSVFLTTASHVFQSTDDGSNWTEISAGLPTSAHITDIRHIKEPGGASLLYVFTNGWSVFKRLLHQPFAPPQRAITVKGVMGITYNGSLVNFDLPPGGLIDGRLVGFVHSVEVFKYTNGNNKVYADMTIRATYREDDSVEVKSDLWLDNFYSGMQKRSPGVSVVLDPGSSYYQNVNVTIPGGSNGGIVDVDFLVTN
jgi:photosystem II stability/assembly factor-like uncharacterized protein